MCIGSHNSSIRTTADRMPHTAQEKQPLEASGSIRANCHLVPEKLQLSVNIHFPLDFKAARSSSYARAAIFTRNCTRAGVNYQQKSTLHEMFYSPSIHFLYPLNPSVGSRGGWSLSQRSSGERWGTPWTGRQSITGPHRDKHTHNHTHS